MNVRHVYNVLSKAGSLGFQQVFADKILLLGGFLIYSVIMILYGGVINMIPPEDIAPYGLTNANMIWYLATTELVLFCSVNWVYKDVQQDINSEKIHLSLIKPFPSALIQVAIWYGEACARLVIYFPAYFVFMTLYAGGFTMPLDHVIGLLFSFPIGAFLLMAGSYMVGASCLWVIQSEVSFFIWQKLVFLLGAMMWPLIVYPDWAQTLAWLSPFPAVLAASGSWVLNETIWMRLGIAAHQVLWGVLFFVLLLWYDKRVLQKIQKGES